MKAGYILSSITISSLMAISGCAETKSIGSSVGQGVGSLVTAVVTGAVEGVQTGLGVKPTNQGRAASNKLPNDDMVYLFGWMEDACIGDQPPYDQIREKYTQFTDSIVTSKEVSPKSDYDLPYEYMVKPNSQWTPEYRKLIKNIKVSNDSGEISYRITFNNNVMYRGQPLSAYEFQFQAETEGSQQSLEFAPNANTSTVWSRFYTRKVSPYWAERGQYVDAGARYNPSSQTMVCYGD